MTMIKKGRAVQYLTAIVVSLGTAAMGTFSGWPTPVVPKLKNNEAGFSVTEGQIGWMLASASPGFMIGSFITRYVSDGFGRKIALLASSLPMLIGMVTLLTAIDATMLYVTKFFWSFGTGMVANVASIYLAEIGDKDMRASLSVITRFAFNFGVLVVMAAGTILSFSTLNWLLIALPVFFFVFCIWIPESPYYYLKEGRYLQARTALSRLRGKSGEELENELCDLDADVKKETKQSSSFWELFSGKRYRRALFIAAGLKVTQILTGTVTLQQYLGLIVEDGKMSITTSTAVIVFAAIRFVVSFMSSFFVDRVGRVPLLLYSYAGTGVALTVAGGCFHYRSASLSSEPWLVGSYVAFVCIILANVISTVGFITITMVITAEIFPLNVKDVAMTSINVFGGLLAMVVTKAFEGIMHLSGLYGVFWVFASVAFVGAVFSGLAVPETRGKSLKEIQVMLQGDMYGEDDTNETVKDLISKNENNQNVSTIDTEMKNLNDK